MGCINFKIGFKHKNNLILSLLGLSNIEKRKKSLDIAAQGVGDVEKYMHTNIKEVKQLIIWLDAFSQITVRIQDKC